MNSFKYLDPRSLPKSTQWILSLMLVPPFWANAPVHSICFYQEELSSSSDSGVTSRSETWSSGRKKQAILKYSNTWTKTVVSTRSRDYHGYIRIRTGPKPTDCQIRITVARCYPDMDNLRIYLFQIFHIAESSPIDLSTIGKRYSIDTYIL